METRRHLRRFYYAKILPPPGQTVVLSPEESRHLKSIIRLKEGDECLLTDSQGQEAVAVVLSFPAGNAAELRIVSEISAQKHPAMYIRIFQAMPRHGKVEFLIQKGQELGLDEFRPLATDRTTVKIAAGRETSKMERWNRIAREAAKQSGAAVPLRIEPPVSLREAVSAIPEGAEVALFHPSGDAADFPLWFEGLNAKTSLNLFFGPEGGFSGEEVDFLSKHAAASKWSFNTVRLGERILKSDTAFTAVLGALRLLRAGEKTSHD